MPLVELRFPRSVSEIGGDGERGGVTGDNSRERVRERRRERSGA